MAKDAEWSHPGDGKYPERLDGESDRAFLSRIMPILPTPDRLREQHTDYFECAGATILPLHVLRTTKGEHENAVSGANAAKAMAAAQAGVVAKRAPVTVRPNGDGSFDIQDGNATFTAARTYGWTGIPVLIGVPANTQIPSSGD